MFVAPQETFKHTSEEWNEQKQALFRGFSAIIRYAGASEKPRSEIKQLCWRSIVAQDFCFARPLPKRRGRPQSDGPKYEVPFLKYMADVFDKTRIKFSKETAAKKILKLFLKKNPSITEILRKGENTPITLDRILQLLSLGRAARTHIVFWWKGKYLIFDKSGLSTVYDTVVGLDPRPESFSFDEAMNEFFLWLDLNLHSDPEFRFDPRRSDH
jgi:hypothetical protein